MNRLLLTAGFRNRERARANVAFLATRIPADVQARLAHSLATSADPDNALAYLVRFEAEKPDDFRRITRVPTLLVPLVNVFSFSRFLSEEILQHPEWFLDVVLGADFRRHLTPAEIEGNLEDFLIRKSTGVLSALNLAEFRRQQILRILLRDVGGACNLAETTEELSNLADALLNVTCRHIRDELARRYGTPRYVVESGESHVCGFSVVALGKLGGQELNYSSDIDLMYVYTANGETDGARSITNKEFFKKAANQHTQLLGTHTAEGICYRVDLRLRPEGSLGEVCISLGGAREYYQHRARAWELQMLIKARVAAGDKGPGRELLDFVEPLIYSSSTDFKALESVAATRERIQEKLHQRRASRDTDIKLAPGGIRDIEFLVQCLQRLHGGREHWVRHGGTLHALFRLRDKGLLSDGECSRLTSAYLFLRHLEHRLQFEHDLQTHTLPSNPDELQLLAQRMPASEMGGDPAAERLVVVLQRHFQEVHDLYTRVVHRQPGQDSVPLPPRVPAARPGASLVFEDSSEKIARFLHTRAPNLARQIRQGGLKRGARTFERYAEWVVTKPEWLGWLDTDPILAGYLIDIFQNSPYFSEQMMRFPEMLIELKRVRERPGEDSTIGDAELLDDPNDLRRFFRREMFRIQAESICLSAPVFETLKRTSSLAVAAIRTSYRLAIEQTLTTHPPSRATYRAAGQMMVIALGRLGMLEFDLGSDADLIFVVPDEDADEHIFWTHVARRTIDRLAAYTGEGVMFSVDTRLRPNGREGELVQLESSYREYFAGRAEAWEGITYLKARGVAGDLDRATDFLVELQDVDWRRYGQSGRSREQLRQMRARLEREQGTESPLKAGRGGFYDIDFSLLYLRLKSASVFFKVLNTPERIRVLEDLECLDRADANFLRDAATFYRAVDHALRVMLGHAEGSLPKAHAQADNLTRLVDRWIPDHLHDQDIGAELFQIQSHTREFFDRLFG